MKGMLYKVWSKFLTWFGKLKILSFGHLPIIAYDPDPFYVSGYDIMDILNLLRPGDVLLRGYNKYLDGKYIPDERGYSHAGLCVGNNQVVHAVSPCVEKCHAIDFCQADRIMVLRPTCGHENAVDEALRRVGTPYDFDYQTDEEKLYCFELVAKCYPEAELQLFEVKKFFGLVKRRCYIAKSIYGNPSFMKVFERNAKASARGEKAHGVWDLYHPVSD